MTLALFGSLGGNSSDGLGHEIVDKNTSADGLGHEIVDKNSSADNLGHEIVDKSTSVDGFWHYKFLFSQRIYNELSVLAPQIRVFTEDL